MHVDPTQQQLYKNSDFEAALYRTYKISRFFDVKVANNMRKVAQMRVV